ncbi:MAG TPA: ABATE domain-containing protein [Vineibacter sp.]|nr:ABATE domain-containing protein [Vineibacter sp.]
MAAPAPARSVLLPARADLCLDYANSRYWRGSEAPTDELTSLEDVLAWHGARTVVPAETLAAMRGWWRERPRIATTAFSEALAMRESLYRLFGAIAGGAAPSERDLGKLNRALSGTPARAQLRRMESGYAWQVPRLRPAVGDLLAPVLWSAADLLTSARLPRLRLCANDKCLYLFVDDSRTGTRRWCTMSTCGNRAKAHRHYIKNRQD